MPLNREFLLQFGIKQKESDAVVNILSDQVVGN